MFNELIHAPRRLRICAILAAAERAEFGTLRDALDVSDSVLSKHLAVLEAALYITTRREMRASRHRVWVSLTPEGLRAYTAHVRALQEIMNQGRPATLPGDPAGTVPS